MGRGMGPGRVERARDPRGALRRLAAYLAPHKARAAAVVGLVVVATGLEVLGPYLMGLAIDRYIIAHDVPGLARLALLMGATYLALWLAQVGQPYLMVDVSHQALRALRRDLFARLQELSLAFYDRQPVGELMSRLTNDIDAINQALAQSIVHLAAGLLSVLAIVAAMFALNAWLALGTLTILPFMLLLTGTVARRTRRGFRQVQERLGRLNALMEENISGARVVQAFARQREATSSFRTTNEAVRRATVRAQVYTLLLPPLLFVLGNLEIAIVAALGGWLALQGLVTVGVVAAFVSYSRRFFRPLRELADLYNTVQSAIAGAERVFALLDQQPTVRDAPDAQAPDAVAGHIVFRDVSFCYEPGVPVLSEVSLEALPGQTIALVGPTGAGKTTIVHLLARFYDVDEGAVLLDGRDLRSLPQDWLRRQLGIVLQDTYLFSDTVLENIRYGRLDATDEECIAAARLANADQFISRLPQGYRTMLSERGSNLSQGQRQLLAIARAALAEPRILILDEATSSVDTRTELQIRQALLKLMQGRTSFVIAHRLSTIRQADQVVVVTGGRIVERGTHEELLAARGAYYRLYLSQYRAQPVAPAAE